MSTIDIVVPCYNEEEGLAHFVEVTNSVIDAIPQHKFRYILVNAKPISRIGSKKNRLSKRTHHAVPCFRI